MREALGEKTEESLVKSSQELKVSGIHQGFQCLLVFSGHKEDRPVVM